MEAGRANLSPTARTALPKLGKPIRSPQCLRSDCSLFPHCSAPAAPRWSTLDSFRKNQEPRGPEMSPNAARSRLRSGTPRGPPIPWTATRQRRSRVSSPKSHLPIPTHRCAPSRVPDADVRSTLTAAAAAAAAESWNSPTPSPPGPRTPGQTAAAAPVATASTSLAAAAPPPPSPLPPVPAPPTWGSAHWPSRPGAGLGALQQKGRLLALVRGALVVSCTLVRRPQRCRTNLPPRAACRRTGGANLRNKSPFAFQQ